jgi:galactose mutarotase-like enzyme
MIRLENTVARAEIDPLGAELRRWAVGDTPLIWAPDPAIWADTAPILFPIVGWTRGGGVEVAGRRYPLGLHGFARTMTFRVLEQWPTHARLGLAASPASRALYPFDWSLEVRYTLDGAALEVRIVVCNLGDGPMPYACGLHPGFRWPFAGGMPDDYEIVFAERESSSVPVISAEGLFTRQSRRLPLDGRRLALSPALLSREALCFLDARSRGLRFAHPSGAAIDVSLEDFPHIALWSRPPGRFLSIEAWTGFGDRVDADGDLFEKDSMRHLPAGAQATHAAKFSFAPPHLLFR